MNTLCTNYIPGGKILADNIITAQLQIAVLGESDDSMSKYISSAIRALDKKGVQYQVTPMGTAIQAQSMDDIMDACRTAHDAVMDMGVHRVLTHITIDHRVKGKTMDEKVQSVLSRL